MAEGDRYQHMIGAALTADIDTSNNSVTFSDTQTGQALASADAKSNSAYASFKKLVGEPGGADSGFFRRDRVR